jgi:GT2 family glycosyltransferase
MGSPGEDVAVSVIVPVRNGADLLGTQLEALAGQTYQAPWELLVSDNGSTDASREVALGWSVRIPRLRVVDAGARRGPSSARNIAAAQAEGRLLLFCDADDRVSAGWIDAMVAGLDRAEIVTGPVTLAVGDGREISTTTAVPKYVGRYPYASGASLGIRRSVFDELDGFDTTISGSSSTDVELALRAGTAGHTITFVDGAAITKYRREGARGTFAQWFWYGRGGAWISRRHRRSGVNRTVRRSHLRATVWLVRHAAAVRTPEGRRHWVRWAGMTSGWLVGTLQYRQVPAFTVGVTPRP